MGEIPRQLQVGNVHATEEPKRGDAAARVVFVLLRQRLAALELNFSGNHVAPRTPVADDQDVIDQNLRPFVDGKLHIDARFVGRERGQGLNGNFLVPAIQIEHAQRIGVGCDLRLEIRLAGCRAEALAQGVCAERAVAFECDRLDDGPRPFGNLHPHADRRNAVHRLTAIDLRRHLDAGKSALAVKALDARGVGADGVLVERLPRFGLNQGRQLGKRNGHVAHDILSLEHTLGAVRDVEDDPQDALRRIALIVGARHAVAALAEVALDAEFRVFKEVFVDRVLAGDRHQLVALARCQRISLEDDLDMRPEIDTEDEVHIPIVVHKSRELRDARLVVTLRAQIFGIAQESGVEREAVVSGPSADVELGQQICGRRCLSLHFDRANRCASAWLNTQDE